MNAYSQFFSCVYDEAAPVGNIGGKAHYSIFRVAEWYDVLRFRLYEAQIHDFAVIWDEDHDRSAIAAAEKLYLAGLFSPVLYIGKRKASLTIVVAREFRESFESYSDWEQWEIEVASVCDELHVEVECCDSGHGPRSPDKWDTRVPGLIDDHPDRVAAYLKNIGILWKLGTWPQQTTSISNVSETLPVADYGPECVIPY